MFIFLILTSFILNCYSKFLLRHILFLCICNQINNYERFFDKNIVIKYLKIASIINAILRYFMPKVIISLDPRRRYRDNITTLKNAPDYACRSVLKRQKLSDVSIFAFRSRHGTTTTSLN